MPSFNDMWGNLDDGYPNDWIPADPGIDDWVRPAEWYTRPPSAPVPGSPQPVLGPQPDPSASQAGTVPNSSPGSDPSSSAGVGALPPKPDPFAAYFSMIPASSLIPLAGAPPILPGSVWQPPPPPWFELPLHLANGGIFGGIGQRLADQKAAANDPWAAARNTIVGGFADPPLAADGLPLDFGQGGIVGSLRRLGPSSANSQADPDFTNDLPFLLPNAGRYQSLDPNSLVRPVADTWEEEEHQRQQEQRQFDMFNARAFGTTPHPGSLVPRQIPPAGRNTPPPFTPRVAPQPSQTPAPSPRGSAGAPSPSPVAPASGAPSSDAPKSDFSPSGASEQPPTPILPSGKFSPYDTYSRQWLPPTQGIQNALAKGSGVQDAISAALPRYDKVTTYSVLITDEGDVVPFRSAGANSFYPTYASGGHAETQAARWMFDHGSSGGVLYHNNTRGTCGFCDAQLATFLPKGVRLWAVPPAGAQVELPGDVVYPKLYVGNAKTPIISRQLDFFGRTP